MRSGTVCYDAGAMRDRRNATGVWLLTHGLLLAGLWLFSLWAWPNLPERIPMHFDFHGNPDRWAAGSSYEWFLLPTVASVLVALLLAPAIAMPRIPVGTINLPNKKAFLQLPRERQLAVLGKVSVMLYSIALLPNLLMLYLQVTIYRVAQGASSGLSAVPVLAVTVAALLGTALWVVHLSRAIDREVELFTTGRSRPS